MIGPEFTELQRHGLHDKNSHDNDQSKNFTYNQIVSVVKAVKTAPTLSGAVLRRNLLDQGSPTKTIPVQRRVYAARKEVSSWTIALDH